MNSRRGKTIRGVCFLHTNDLCLLINLIRLAVLNDKHVFLFVSLMIVLKVYSEEKTLCFSKCMIKSNKICLTLLRL